MVEEFDAATTSLGGHGGLGSGIGSGPGHNRATSHTNDYDERMQELKKHNRHMQDHFKRQDMRRKKSDQEKAQKWIQYKAAMRKQRDDEIDQLRLREKRSREPRPLPQPCLRTQGSGQISSNAGGENGTRAGSVVGVVPGSPGKGESEVDIDSRVSTARKTQVFPPIAECRESSPGSEGSGRRRNVRKAAVTVARTRKKKDDAAPTPRAGVQREKSVMQQAQEEFQGLYKSEDGVAILKMGSKRHQMHREALVRLDQKAVDETKLDHGEDHAEEEQQNEVQEQPTVSNKHMARRYRLRMMQQITSQVLQCRRKMANNNCQMSFLSLNETDLSSQSELIM